MENRVGRVAIVAAFLATVGCAPIDEGREQSSTFTTPLSSQDITARAERYFVATGYTVVQADGRRVRAEKQRTSSVGPAQTQIDTILIQMTEVAEGTRVTLTGWTDLMTGGQRAQSREASREVIGDVRSLADILLVRVVPSAN